MNPELLLWIILLLPFAGFLLLILSGKSANTWAGWLGLGFSLVGFGLSFSTTQLPTIEVTHTWISEALPFTLRADDLTQKMLLLVLFIASLVQLFSLEYMREDSSRFRYFAFLQLFVGSMLGILLANNLLILYVFWELVGLSSYLLISFWYTKPEAVLAARKAFLVNRIGDVGLALGIFGVYNRLGTLDFTALTTPEFIGDPYWTAIGLLLFCGTLAKSAQFPLHVWLPDAMEGPTPVSALIHAATMVAAGVYLLARIFPILTPEALIVIAIIGTITMVMGALYALTQTDIKKTMAYSTVSQLGLMVLAVGVGAPHAAMFHLFTHAFFKAGLFLSSGSVIHSLHHAGHGFDAQDVRLMGGLRKKLPVTFIAYTVCAAALSGLPFTSGFLSKDEILHEAFHATAHSWKLVFPVAATISAGLTAFYMAKQWRLVFFGNWRNDHLSLESVHESSWLQKLPLVLLAALSLPFLFSWNPLGEHLDLGVALGSTAVALIGIVMAWIRYRSIERLDQIRDVPLLTLDQLYHTLIVNPFLKFADFCTWVDRVIVDGIVNASAKSQVILAHLLGWLDRYVVDGIPTGTAYVVGTVGKVTRRFQGGQVQSYIVATMLGLAALLIWWTW
ncbi:NADH-quinone oxidoreductase subunit L [Siphonobacter sp. SORGH_AS_0500]|uniref:NADH-quinone oxidoreductase subunit L n=1 Tax=Siphonobacter sp. SORGH_AS_0500 TaxID=1864824 RepID=UPI00285D3C02|nr:NADH-quinone oxidoreductase subunit L [Siphonobacter sp. SORGH_AS_0500]MDR6194163.1 NADH-quinone oxidoreductase subunit L [Siphonobacter sp. SORGH_AS_0500]